MVRQPTTSVVDRLRREVERNALRAKNGIRMVTGLQRTDVGLSPKEVVWTRGRTQLWRYRSDRISQRRPLLIVYSLFNRSYILDLRPGNSMVEHLVEAGFDVFLLDWGVPDERDASNRLEDYVNDYIPAAVERVRSLSADIRVDLLGYCFGGVLAMLYAARHGSSSLTSLTAIATPADLHELGPLAEILAQANLDDLLDKDGMVSASVIVQGFRSLAPVSELSSRVDLVARLWSEDYVATYQALSGWVTDQVPLPGGVAQELQTMTRDNSMLHGTTMVGGGRVRLADIRVPFLHVMGTRDHIIPEACSAPLVGLVGSLDRRELRLDAGHVGLMVGRLAARETVPALVEFLTEQSEPM